MRLARPVLIPGYLIAVAALLTTGCVGALKQTQAPAESGQGIPKQLQERQVIVTLALATRERWAGITRALGMEYALGEVGAFPLNSIGVQCVVFQIPADRPVDAVIRQLAADPRVETVQPNQVFKGLRAIHTDPYAALQYGAGVIRAEMAHHRSTGREVKVAVVDTGVDKEHPDLRGRIVQTANFVEGGERSFTQDRHGTAVAGVIGARADDGVGIFGIAPEANLLAVKACWYPRLEASQALCSSWTLAKAIDFSLNAGAQILNMSLSGPPDPLLIRLLKAATARGITIVAAVAEEGALEPGFPASLDPVIAVIASDAQRRVHVPLWEEKTRLLAAPGMEVLTTTPREAYDFLSGSSLAAAHVTGVVALLLEHKPLLSPYEALELLQASVRPASTPNGAVHPAIGIIDACAALTKLTGAPACP